MTNEEAISHLRGYLDTEIYTDRCAEAHQIAVEAVEKQIPKKPVYYKEEHREENTYSKREFYKCPLCNNDLFIQNHKEKIYTRGKVTDRYPQGNRTKHCCFCGQAIDWSDKQ